MAKKQKRNVTSPKALMVLLVTVFSLIALFFCIKQYFAPVSYVFVQNARTAQLEKLPDNTYRLTLHLVSPGTLYFSDRPNRLTGTMHTENFIKDWTVGENSFSKNPPNASLTGASFVSDTDEEVENIVVVLSNPHYDVDTRELTYNVHADDATTLPTGTFSNASLFIDSLSIGTKVTPVSGGISIANLYNPTPTPSIAVAQPKPEPHNYRIVTNDGSSVIVTAQHPISTGYGPIQARDLQPGDPVVTRTGRVPVAKIERTTLPVTTQ